MGQTMFNKLSRPLLPIFLLLSLHSLYAESTFPRGCKVTGFSYNPPYLILNETGNQAYYLIQNRSNVSIELERHETTEAFMSPPLHVTIDPMNWAAFASDVQDINFRCYHHVNEEIAMIDCRDVLDVCQYPNVKFAQSNLGNYWISWNKSQEDIIHDSVAKGIYLKW
jgi:hypothetical protein